MAWYPCAWYNKNVTFRANLFGNITNLSIQTTFKTNYISIAIILLDGIYTHSFFRHTWEPVQVLILTKVSNYRWLPITLKQSNNVYKVKAYPPTSRTIVNHIINNLLPNNFLIPCYFKKETLARTT